MPDDYRDRPPTAHPGYPVAGDTYPRDELPATVRVPEFLTIARGVQSVGFLERHRVASLIAAGLTTMAMIIGGLLIFL